MDQVGAVRGGEIRAGLEPAWNVEQISSLQPPASRLIKRLLHSERGPKEKIESFPLWSEI
jgi:hypothetical protein